MKNCLHCNKEFEPDNPKGVYCSPRCRTYHHRGITHKPNLLVLDDPGEGCPVSELDGSVGPGPDPIGETGVEGQNGKDYPKDQSKYWWNPRVFPHDMKMDAPASSHGTGWNSRMKRLKEYNQEFKGTQHYVPRKKLESQLAISGYDVKLSALAYE